METKLYILVCESVNREIETVIGEEHCSQFVLVPFPSLPTDPFAYEPFLTTLQETIRQGHDLICLPERELISHIPTSDDMLQRCYEYCKRRFCCKLFLNESLFAYYQETGAFLLLPGLLAHWQRYVTVIQEQSRMNHVNRLVLLDTGLAYAHTTEYLMRLSQAVELPIEVIPVGLEYLRLFIKDLLFGWLLQRAGGERSNLATDFFEIRRQFEQQVESRTSQMASAIKKLEWEVQIRKGAESALRESRKWYQRLLASVTDYIYTVQIIDGHPAATTHGPACVAVTGYTSEEYELDPLLWYRMIYPDDQPFVLDQITRLLAGETTHSIEHRIIHKDGSVRWVKNTPVLRYDDDGNLVAYDGLITDITERREAEDALRESEERYRQLNAELELRVAERTAELEAANRDLQKQIAERQRIEEALHKSEERLELAMLGSDDGFWDWDVASGIDYFSPRWAEMLGYEMGEIEPHMRSWERLIHPDDLPRVQDVLQKHIAGYTPLFEVRHRIKTKSGEWKWVLYRGKVVQRDSEGRPIRMAGTQRDITQLKQAEEDLQRAKEAAEAGYQAKSEFLANMSHEIRTPMNAIIGMTNLLLDTPLTPEQRDFAETIYTSSNALLTLINDVLDFSKIDGGKMVLENHPFNMVLCIEESLDLVAAAAEEKRLGLTYRVEPGTPIHLVGDVTRVRQILVNLLSNAVKFTERGEVIVSVSASIPEVEARVHPYTTSQRIIHIAVSDTGIGIAPHDMDRLFQSFSQIDTSITRKYGGTGLGLVISRKLAEMMRGRIWVESELGKGSTFHVTFRAEVLEEQHRKQETNMAEICQFFPTDSDSLRNKRLLVVDDRTQSRTILVDYGTSWGMQTIGASSIEEAIALIRSEKPFDVLVLNLHDNSSSIVSQVKRIRQAALECIPITTSIPPDAIKPPPIVLWTALSDTASSFPDELEAAMLNRPIKPSRFYNVLIDVLLQKSTSLGNQQFQGDGRKPLQPIPVEFATIGHRNPLRLLVVEDNAINQKVALRLLERLGYRADVAANGLEALESLRRQDYDVIFMDVQMPEMDGFVATQHIRAQWPAHLQPYIVAMTAHTLPGYREKCLEAGMDNYISKPVTLEQLVNSLEQIRTRHISLPPPEPSLVPEPVAAESFPLHVVRIDPDALRNFRDALGDDAAAVIQEIIQLYIADTPRLIAGLRESLMIRDRETFTRSAHTLKSSSAQVGAVDLARLCKDIELLGHAGSLDAAEALVVQVEQLYAPTRTALEQFIVSEFSALARTE